MAGYSDGSKNIVGQRQDPRTVTAFPASGYGMFGSTSKKAINELRRSMHRNECDHRRALARDVECIWHNEYERLVDKALADMYDPQTYADVKMSSGMVSKRHNLLRDVIVKMATTWDGGSRQWLSKREDFDVAAARLVMASMMPADDGTPESVTRAEYWLREAIMADEDGDIVSPEFDAVMEAMDVENSMKRIDGLTLRHPRIARIPQIVFDPSIMMRRLTYTTLTPEHFSLGTADAAPAMVNEFIWFYTTEDDRGREVPMRRVWTSELVWTEKNTGRDGEEKWQHTSDPEPNMLRRIPASLFGNAVPGDSAWLDNDGEMLAENTIAINKAQTYLDLLMFIQTKVLAGEFKPGSWPVGQNIAPGTVVNFPVGAQSVQAVDLQTDVTRFRTEYIAAPRREVNAAVGLSPDEFEVRAPESGEAKKMRYWQRDRKAKTRLIPHRQGLADLYWLTCQVLWFALREQGAPPILGFERGLTPPYVPGVQPRQQPVVFRVDVQDFDYPELSTERQAREDRDMAQGLTSVIDLYKARNPEVTDDATAEAQIIKNRQINKRLGMGRPSGMQNLLTQQGGTP